MSKSKIEGTKWKVRTITILYFSALLTVIAPLAPVNSPTLTRVSASAEPLQLKDYAETIALEEYRWDGIQIKCLNILWGKESAWNPLADNPESTAFGIAQILGEKSKDPMVQISNGLKYIDHRYESPCRAWEFWKKNKWY